MYHLILCERFQYDFGWQDYLYILTPKLPSRVIFQAISSYIPFINNFLTNVLSQFTLPDLLLLYSRLLFQISSPLIARTKFLTIFLPTQNSLSIYFFVG
jgi:hypothetical protein